ncbi:MAG: hypothetical protein OJF49_001593 [Ktedonobacterales bacterium]|nr:MAG: hypothetical protein OJF49_001593 [Ktedonobacterales bacterium]
MRQAARSLTRFAPRWHPARYWQPSPGGHVPEARDMQLITVPNRIPS